MAWWVFAGSGADVNFGPSFFWDFGDHLFTTTDPWDDGIFTYIYRKNQPYM